MNTAREFSTFQTFVAAVMLFIAPFGASAHGVDTLPAANVTASSATLRGQFWLLPDGGYACFEWGETAAYGNMTVWTNVMPVLDAVGISYMLSGLKVNTRYHYRLVFEDWYGDAFFGEDETFVTSIFIEIGATNVTANSATLRGTVCANDVSVTAWFKWRDANGNGTDETNGPPLRISARTNSVPLRQPVSGLSPGHTYTCDLCVTDGNRTNYGSQVITTPLLAAPITLSGVAVTASSATLTGSANPRSLPTTTWFEWGTTSNYYGNRTPSLDIGAGNTGVPVSMDISQLSCLSDYHYRLVVSNAAGVVYGADQQVSTPSGTWLPDGIYVSPTLIPSNTATHVTVTSSGSIRFNNPNLPECRVRLTRDGQPIVTRPGIEIGKVAATKLYLTLPPLVVGFYGFMIEGSNEVTHVWEEIYQSGPRFFQVGDEAVAHVYHPYPRGNWTAPTNPKQFIGTDSCVVTGAITGKVYVPQYVHPYLPAECENSGIQSIGWKKDFRLDDEGDAGVELEFTFPMDGYVTYDYDIPFVMSLDFPTNVYGGQKLQLKVREFRLQTPRRLTAERSLDFSTYHKLWVNAPYDLKFPPLVNEHLFEHDGLEIWGQIPVAPGKHVHYGPFDSRETPWRYFKEAYWFDDGSVTTDEISGALPDASVTLGGHTEYTIAGTWNRSYQYPLDVWMSEWEDAPQLWHADADTIALVAALNIPYISAGAGVLSAAQVELDLDVGVNVRSRDVIGLKPPYSHGVEVFIPAAFTNGSYTIATNLSLTIDATFVSYYLYSLWGGLYFDMPFISRKNLDDWGSDAFWSPEVSVNVPLTATCTVSRTVWVRPKSDWINDFVVRAPAQLNAGSPVAAADEDYDLISYPPAEADEERRWIADLSFKGPPPPPMVPSIILGTLQAKPESACALMLWADPPGGGTITVDRPAVDGGYSNGTVVTVTAQAAPGCLFTGWSGDVSGATSPATLTMNGVQSVVANFTAPVAGLGNMTNGVFRFEVVGTTGRQWIVECSTNLLTAEWVPLATNTAPFSITDTNAAGAPQRFYRLQLLP